MALAPGKYGPVTLKKGSTLVLGQGTYVFKSLALGQSAIVQYDQGGKLDVTDPNAEMSLAPTERTFLFVLGDLTLDAGASITPGSSDRSNRLKVFAPGTSKLVSLGSGTIFHGSLIAPQRSVVFGTAARLAGAVYARRIEFGAGATFQPHAHPDEAPLPSAPIASLTSGATDATPATDLGMSFALAQNHPNPFRTRSVTLVRFALPEARNVRLDVFDVSGRMVKTLAQGPMGAGLHTLSWNGTGNSGSHLPSGVYLYRLVAGRDRAQRKMILMD